MLRKREKYFLGGVFLIVLFYVVTEHFEVFKSIFMTCYSAISPLIYGIVIAFILNLIVVKLEKYMTKGIFQNHTFKRTTSIIASLLILLGIITIVCFSVIPGIVDSAMQIADKAPQAIETSMNFLKEHLSISDEMINEVMNFKLDKDMINSMFGLIENESVMDAIKASGNVVGSIFTTFARFFMGLFFAFYILAKKESIGVYMHKLIVTYLPENVGQGLETVGHIVYDTYANFISGQCVDAVILGCLVAVTMGIMGLPYSVLIGVVITVTALIPVVGALFGGAIGTVLLVMDSPIKALTFLIVFLILQQIDNRLIYPHIVGNAIGIPSILIFAAIIIGGEFNGVIGMFLGIPFTAVIYTLIERDIKKRRLKKQQIEKAAKELHGKKR